MSGPDNEFNLTAMKVAHWQSSMGFFFSILATWKKNGNQELDPQKEVHYEHHRHIHISVLYGRWGRDSLNILEASPFSILDLLAT